MQRYNNTLYSRKVQLDTENKRRYYNTLLDPQIPLRQDDIYVITTYGDRLDSLAWNYYGDAGLWWIVAAANPQLRKDSLYLEPGLQLRIPRDSNTVLSLYQDENSFE
jgi:phage tail protein X